MQVLPKKILSEIRDGNGSTGTFHFLRAGKETPSVLLGSVKTSAMTRLLLQ